MCWFLPGEQNFILFPNQKHGTFCLMKCFLMERVFARIIQFLDCKLHASCCEKIYVSIALYCLTRALQSFEE